MTLPQDLRQGLLLEEALDTGNGGLVVKVQEVADYLRSYKALELLPLYHRRTQQQNHAVHVARVHRSDACVLHVAAHLQPPLLQVPMVTPPRELRSLEVLSAPAAEVAEQLLVGCVEPEPRLLLRALALLGLLAVPGGNLSLVLRGDQKRGLSFGARFLGLRFLF